MRLYTGAVVDADGYVEFRFSFFAGNDDLARRKAGKIARAWSAVESTEFRYVLEGM